jgi:hypothetical protein
VCVCVCVILNVLLRVDAMVSGLFTIPYVWVTHGTKVILIDFGDKYQFGVKGSEVKHTGRYKSKMVFGLLSSILFIKSHHITHMDYPGTKMIPINFGVKGQGTGQ